MHEKKDISAEVYKECKFTPQANSPRNDKLARKKYEKDAVKFLNQQSDPKFNDKLAEFLNK